jgi:hypothetical protein
MTYKINHAHSYTGTLSTLGLMVEYDTRRELLAAVAPVLGLDVQTAAWVRVDDQDGLEYYLYRSQSAADADDNGSQAVLFAGLVAS